MSDVGPITRALRVLRSQQTGLICAALSAALLAIGSVVMDRVPEPYQGLAYDDLRFFFQPIRAVHWWFYASAAVLGVWGLSTLLCTLVELSARIRRRVLRPSAYGAPIVHLAFLMALVSHLWGGLTAETRVHIVYDSGTEIAGATYRLLGIEPDLYPNGMPRRITATLQRESGEGTEEVTVGYNEPIVLGAGAITLLMGRTGRVAVATLVVQGESLELTPGERRPLTAGGWVELHRVISRPGLRVPVADLTVSAPEPERTMLPLTPGAPAGTTPAFSSLRGSMALSLTERDNPSMPLTIALSALLVVGVLLVGAERVWRQRRRRSAG